MTSDYAAGKTSGQPLAPRRLDCTPELAAVLGRYLEIQQEEKRLAEEKAGLRDILIAGLGTEQAVLWHTVLAGQRVSVRHTSSIHIDYNEQLLLQRLGERYVRILKPDITKVRRNLSVVEPHLQPVLLLVGSPDREKVRDAINGGIARQEEFEGAFKKSLRHVIAVAARPGGRGERTG